MSDSEEECNAVLTDFHFGLKEEHFRNKKDYDENEELPKFFTCKKEMTTKWLWILCVLYLCFGFATGHWGHRYRKVTKFLVHKPIMNGEDSRLNSYPDCKGIYLYPQTHQKLCYTWQRCRAGEEINKHSFDFNLCYYGDHISCPAMKDPRNGRWKPRFGHTMYFEVYTEIILKCNAGYKPNKESPVIFCTDKKMAESSATWNDTSIDCIPIHRNTGSSTKLHVYIILIVVIFGLVCLVVIVFILWYKKIGCFALYSSPSSSQETLPPASVTTSQASFADTQKGYSSVPSQYPLLNPVGFQGSSISSSQETASVTGSETSYADTPNEYCDFPGRYPLCERTGPADSVYHLWLKNLLESQDRMDYLIHLFKKKKHLSCKCEIQMRDFLKLSEQEIQYWLDQWKTVCQPMTGFFKLMQQRGDKTKEDYMKYLRRNRVYLPTNFWNFDKSLDTSC